MRTLAESLRLRGDRKPSLSLIARRSIGLYLDRLADAKHGNPESFAREMLALEKMTAPVCPQTTEKARREKLSAAIGLPAGTEAGRTE